jgi:hypothetical protein
VRRRILRAGGNSNQREVVYETNFNSPRTAGSQSQHVISNFLNSAFQYQFLRTKMTKAKHTGGKVDMHRIQNAPWIATSEKENLRILLWCEIMRETDRRGVADGIEKGFFGPINRMGHLLVGGKRKLH